MLHNLTHRPTDSSRAAEKTATLSRYLGYLAFCPTLPDTQEAVCMLSGITAREVILRFGNGSSSEGKHPNLFTASLTNPNSNRVSPLGVEKREQLAPGMNQSEMSCPSASTAPATCSLSASPAPCSVTRKAQATYVPSRTTLLLMLRGPTTDCACPSAPTTNCA